MAAEDWVTFDDWDEEGYFELDDVTCNRCGKEGLEWDWEHNRSDDGVYKKRWFLRDDDGEPHQCPPASADEFEIVANG
jgi:hypothetical protein